VVAMDQKITSGLQESSWLRAAYGVDGSFARVEGESIRGLG